MPRNYKVAVVFIFAALVVIGPFLVQVATGFGVVHVDQGSPLRPPGARYGCANRPCALEIA